MEHLRTARVLVIDDKEDEAIPLIRALGQLGIGCIHISGDNEEELPNQPFEGIRIAFVDMDLNVGGFGEERTRIVVSKTIGVFKKTVSHACPPCLVVAWTKHSDIANAFKEAVASEIPGLVPGSILSIEKPIEFGDDERRELAQTLQEFLQSHAPVPVLWAWEQAAHDAATRVTSLVSEVAGEHEPWAGETDKWLAALSSALRALVHASAGQYPSAAGRHLFESLSSLHLDELESCANIVPDASVSSLLKAGALSDDAKTAFNTRMLISRVDGANTEIRPGCVYLMKCGSGAKQAIPTITVNGQDLSNDYKIDFKKTDDKKLKELMDEVAALQKAKSNTTEIKKKNQKVNVHRRKLRRALLTKCRIALVEVSPICDVAQGKVRMARFVAGILVPANKSCHFDGSKADYFKKLKPIATGVFDEPSELLLNAHFLFTCALADEDAVASAAFQLRQGLVTDIQHWLANMASRPGILVVD